MLKVVKKVYKSGKPVELFTEEVSEETEIKKDKPSNTKPDKKTDK